MSGNKKLETTPLALIIIGVSEGGFEALEEFFTYLPEISNFCVLIAQPLSPIQENALVDLLSKTSSLKVLKAEEGVALREQHVYLTPSEHKILIQENKILVSHSNLSLGSKPFIDQLLESLTQEAHQQVIVVILSSAGVDNAEEGKSTKAECLLINQKSRSITYDAMFDREADMIDVVTSPKKIGKEIQTFLKGRYSKRLEDRSLHHTGKPRTSVYETSQLEDKVRIETLERELLITKERLQASIKEADTYKEELKTVKQALAQTQSALKANEKLLNSVFEVIDIGICITDEQGNLVNVNREYCNIYGYDRSQLIGKHFTLVVPPSNRPMLKSMHDEFIKNGEQLTGEGEFEVINAEGKPLTVASSAKLVIQEEGTRFMMTAIRNISDEAFNRNQLKQLSQNLPVVMFQYRAYADGTDELQNVSEGAIKVWGIPANECHERLPDIWKNIHSDDIEDFVKTVQTSAAKMEAWTTNYRFNHPTRGQLWLRGVGVPRKAPEESIIWDSIVIDVTKEKEAEKAKNKLYYNQTALINNTHDLIWSVDLELRLIVANETFKTIVGATTGTEVKEGDAVLHEIYGDELNERWRKYYERGLGGETFSVTEQAPDIKGKISHFIASFNPIRNELGEITGLACYNKDITEYVEQQKLLEQATQIAHLGYYRHSQTDGYLYWSDEMRKLFDLGDNEPILTREEYAQFILDDDREQVLLAYQNAYEKCVNIDLVYRLALPQRKIKWVREKGNVKVNIVGVPSIIAGTIQDITTQKEEEQRLRLLESVITHTDNAVLITEAHPIDPPGPRILYANDAFCDMTGYTLAEVIGQTPRILQGPKSDKQALSKLKEAMSKWETAEVTLINYRKNGEEFWVNFSVTPVANEKGYHTHWIALEREVTREINEERQKALALNISRVINSEQSYADVIHLVVEQIANFGEFEVAELWIVGPKKTYISLAGMYAKEPEHAALHRRATQQEFQKGEGLPGKVWQAQEILHNRCKEDTHFASQYDAEKPAGISSCFGIPLSYGQEEVGVLILGVSKELRNVELLQGLLESFQRYLGGELRRKRVEEELRILYDTAPDIICLAGFDGYFKQINKAAFEILGYSEAELLSTPFIEFVHPDDQERTLAEVEYLGTGKHSLYFENRYRTKSGTYIWLAWTTNPDLKQGLLFAVAKDITHHKEHEISLQKINRELDQRARELALSNAELEQFAYIASHDLQEPLRMITSFLVRLEEKYADKLDEKALRYIDFAVDGGKRMRQIILDLLEFSRVGKHADKMVEIDTKKVVEEAYLIHLRAIEQSGAHVEIRSMPVILAYPTQLLHIFQNLIGNAIKYRRPDHTPELIISAKEEKKRYIFSIQDNGIGIKSEYFDKIFVIFQRLHNQKEYEGTGMGLAIAKKSVDSMGGEIWLSSEYGEGSTFFFSIPKLS